MEYTSIEYPLKTKIRYKTQPVNAKHMQCQCIVSERSCGNSPYSFDTYLLVRRPEIEKTGLENLKQMLYLCIFWFWIFLRHLIINYTHFEIVPYVCDFLSIGCDFTQ